MIPNHSDFLQAIGEKKLIRITFYSPADSGTVDRECVPLNYGPDPAAPGAPNLYWVWDYASTAGPNPLGLAPGQIVKLQKLGKDFDPAILPAAARRDLPPPPETRRPAPPARPPTMVDSGNPAQMRHVP